MKIWVGFFVSRPTPLTICDNLALTNTPARCHAQAARRFCERPVARAELVLAQYGASGGERSAG